MTKRKFCSMNFQRRKSLMNGGIESEKVRAPWDRSIMCKLWRTPFLRVQNFVRISSTFSLRRPFSYLRHFLHFDPPTLLRPKLYFDLNLTSTFLDKLYFDQNCTSTCTSRPIRSPDLSKGRSTEVEVNESK